MFWYTEKRIKPYFDDTQWHVWFAWYPVIVREFNRTVEPQAYIKKWIWWENVERRWNMYIVNELRFWEYREVGVK